MRAHQVRGERALEVREELGHVAAGDAVLGLVASEELSALQEGNGLGDGVLDQRVREVQILEPLGAYIGG